MDVTACFAYQECCRAYGDPVLRLGYGPVYWQYCFITAWKAVADVSLVTRNRGSLLPLSLRCVVMMLKSHGCKFVCFSKDRKFVSYWSICSPVSHGLEEIGGAASLIFCRSVAISFSISLKSGEFTSTSSASRNNGRFSERVSIDFIRFRKFLQKIWEVGSFAHEVIIIKSSKFFGRMCVMYFQGDFYLSIRHFCSFLYSFVFTNLFNHLFLLLFLFIYIHSLILLSFMYLLIFILIHLFTYFCF